MNEEDASRWKMPLNRAVCMQHLQMLVGLGYRYWNSGLVRNDKLILLVAKFGARFPIAATPGQRAAAKKRGQVNVQLVIFDTREQPGCCRWWLLATPLKSTADAASNSIYSLEPMKDAWEISLEYGPHFVLTRKVRDIAEFEHGKRRRRLQLRWTWEMSKTTFQEWQARLEEAAKHAPGKLYGEFATLRTNPGFAGVNAQIRALDASAGKAWSKQHRRPYVSPLPRHLPTFVGQSKVFGAATAGTWISEWRESVRLQEAQGRLESREILQGKDAPRQLSTILIERSKTDDVEDACQDGPHEAESGGGAAAAGTV